jgi:hypothetical protein
LDQYGLGYVRPSQSPSTGTLLRAEPVQQRYPVEEGGDSVLERGVRGVLRERTHSMEQQRQERAEPSVVQLREQVKHRDQHLRPDGHVRFTVLRKRNNAVSGGAECVSG